MLGSVVEPLKGIYGKCRRAIYASRVSNTRVATIGLRAPFEDMSWRHSHRPLRRKATLGSHTPDDIEKYAFVVVLQIGQVVGKVCKVVADANLEVLADMTIDCCQRASAALT